MKLRKRIFPILFIGILSLVPGLIADAQVLKLRIDGVPRQALIVPPSKDAGSAKAPVVFAFHYHGGTMYGASELMNFQSVWPEAIVVYMQALANDPNAPGGFGWHYDSGPGGDTDLRYFDAVLKTLREQYPVDDRRIYATGFSSGGIFTYSLWGTRASVFAAFASVAGRIEPDVHLSDPKPFLHVGGEQDKNVPFEDQMKAVQTARNLNGATDKGTPCGEHCTMYPSAKGTPVVTYIHGGGHVYPSDTSEVIVKFFKTYALTP